MEAPSFAYHPSYINLVLGRPTDPLFIWPCAPPVLDRYIPVDRDELIIVPQEKVDNEEYGAAIIFEATFHPLPNDKNGGNSVPFGITCLGPDSDLFKMILVHEEAKSSCILPGASFPYHMRVISPGGTTLLNKI